MAEWGFYGRRDELESVRRILHRGRWFFAKITGRRRIGKTTLIRQAINDNGGRPVFYVQVPDSGEAGVISAVNDALDTFGLTAEHYPRPRQSIELVKLLESLAVDGFVVILDEFQYFHRKGFAGFCSLLQAAADRLTADAHRVPGGWVVLGSIHTEMAALLDDRTAPLYGRVTDTIDLDHLDIASVVSILTMHAIPSPERLLFFWTLFEGVPKFYRDCFEQSVMKAERRELLRKMFFESSSPLRSEAETWFLREIGGQADTILKFVARHPGMSHNELVAKIQEMTGDEKPGKISYLQILTERYKLIERKLPVFAPEKARQGRYYVTDNFLTAWLAALASRVAARTFQPVEQLVAEADMRLAEVEGAAQEKLAARLYEERSRRGLGDFPLTRRIDGYWDRKDTEIDLVAVDEVNRRIRFASCKRSPTNLLADVTNLKNHGDRFRRQHAVYQDWYYEYAGVTVRLNDDQRKVLQRNDVIPQDLDDLTRELT